MKKGLISIIVPVYNVEKYLKRCIDSIIFQTYTDIEIILIDDGSSDNSANICDEYLKKDKRIRVIHKKNEGVSIARNVGLEISNGEYIGFVDSDDFIEKDMYEMLVNAIRYDSDVDLSYCDFKDKSVFGENTQLFELESVVNIIRTKFPMGGTIWNCLYRSILIKSNNLRFNNEFSYGEDLIFFTDYINCIRNNKIIHVNEKLYNYEINETSINNTRNNLQKKYNNMYSCYLAVKDAYGKLINMKNIPKDYISKKYAEFFFSSFLYNKDFPYKKEFFDELKEIKTYLSLKQKIYFYILKVNPYFLYIIGNYIIRGNR